MRSFMRAVLILMIAILVPACPRSRDGPACRHREWSRHVPATRRQRHGQRPVRLEQLRFGADPRDGDRGRRPSPGRAGWDRGRSFPVVKGGSGRSRRTPW